MHNFPAYVASSSETVQAVNEMAEEISQFNPQVGTKSTAYRGLTTDVLQPFPLIVHCQWNDFLKHRRVHTDPSFRYLRCERSGADTFLDRMKQDLAHHSVLDGFHPSLTMSNCQRLIVFLNSAGFFNWPSVVEIIWIKNLPCA